MGSPSHPGRLGGWGLRGKAVWFAVPAPLAHARLMDVTGLRAYTLSADVTATRANERLSARQAARELETMLDERGFGGRLVRADQPACYMSILSVCRGLTVWCRSGAVSLTTPEGPSERWELRRPGRGGRADRAAAPRSWTWRGTSPGAQ